MGYDISIVYCSFQNNKPPINLTINGPLSGKIDNKYIYNLSAIDPEGDFIFYYIDWGDENNTGWIGPFSLDTD